MCECSDDPAYYPAKCSKKYCLVYEEPYCVPDCTNVLCPAILCTNGLQPITLPGDCCDSCVDVPDCTGVKCPPVSELECTDDEIAATPADECCPVCIPGICEVDDCIGCDTCDSGRYNDGCNTCTCDDDDGSVSCTDNECETVGQPYCIDDDCISILCDQPTCGNDEFLYRPPGECCEDCYEKPNCDDIACPTLEKMQQYFCEDGEVAVESEIECCPICVPEVCEEDSDDPTPAPTGEDETCIGCDTCESGQYNDGCNTCKCEDDGTVSCTEMECDTPGIPYCVNAGVLYQSTTVEQVITI